MPAAIETSGGLRSEQGHAEQVTAILMPASRPRFGHAQAACSAAGSRPINLGRGSRATGVEHALAALRAGVVTEADHDPSAWAGWAMMPSHPANWCSAEMRRMGPSAGVIAFTCRPLSRRMPIRWRSPFGSLMRMGMWMRWMKTRRAAQSRSFLRSACGTGACRGHAEMVGAEEAQASRNGSRSVEHGGYRHGRRASTGRAIGSGGAEAGVASAVAAGQRR